MVWSNRLVQRTWRSGLAAIGCAAMLAGPVRAARADDAPPRSVMTISAASLKAVSDEADRLGIPLPPFMTAGGIEQTFPFIGDKGMNPDVPIGLDWTMKAGWATAGVNGMLFVFPVKPHIATVDSLKTNGGKAIDDHPDSVQLNADVLRRTDSDLIFGQSAAQDAVFRADPADVTDIYKAPPADGSTDLLHIIANTRNLRETDPSGFYKFLESSAGSDNAQSQKAYASAVEAMIKKIDMVDLGLSRQNQNVRISLSAKPLQLPATGNFNVPGMPDSVMVMVNLAAPLRDIYPQLDDLLKQAAASPVDGSDPQKDFAEAKQVVDMLAAGKAVSAGLTIKGDSGNLYIVEQGADPGLADRMKKACDAVNDAEKTAHAQVSQYTDDAGLSVSRLVGDEPNGKKLYIDGVEKNGNDYFTISEQTDHLVGSLVSLPMGPAMSDLICGTVWPDRILKGTSENGAGLGQALGADTVKKLEDMLKGKPITFSAANKDGGLLFHMDVPEELVKDIVTSLQHGAAGGGGGGGAGGAGGGPGGGL